ncbi:MAG: NAD(P)-dependent glycerol-3-phosphate dehydrogenase [Defluviitaleaceae bacterium]|nr:NAD(P)-dependent glycerol-3-phosphate dehydrogenase [Defluviitaleaceae bacterium]
MKIAVLGFGSFGIALALQLYKNGHDIVAWQRNAEKCEFIKKNGYSAEYLPGVRIPAEIRLTADLADTANCDVILFTAGAKATRELAESFKPFWREGQILVSASKALEPSTNLRLSEVIKEVLNDACVAVISGPCHAEELVDGIVTAYVAAAENAGVACRIQDVFMSKDFRVYTNCDVIGVELGGALKNPIAMALGICDGMGFGHNTRAFSITRGIAEIARLGVAMGAKEETFYGLSGLGDLTLTCTSGMSRNWKAGYLIGQGRTLTEALAEIRMLVEAVHTIEPALAFARKYNVSMPIISELYEILYNGKNPRETVKTLMAREKTSERVLYG